MHGLHLHLSPETLRTKGISVVPLVETTPRWQSPQPAMDCEEVKKCKDPGTKALFPHYFLEWRVVCVEGSGKISTLVPVHLPRCGQG